MNTTKTGSAAIKAQLLCKNGSTISVQEPRCWSNRKNLHCTYILYIRFFRISPTSRIFVRYCAHHSSVIRVERFQPRATVSVSVYLYLYLYQNLLWIGVLDPMKPSLRTLIWSISGFSVSGGSFAALNLRPGAPWKPASGGSFGAFRASPWVEGLSRHFWVLGSWP